MTEAEDLNHSLAAIISNEVFELSEIAMLLDEVGMTKLAKRISNAASGITAARAVMERAFNQSQNEALAYSRQMVGGLLALTVNGNLHPTDSAPYESPEMNSWDKADELVADRLFDEDMAADRERHSIRDEDDLNMIWLNLFGVYPETVKANFFEKLSDGTWKCQLIDDQRNYAQAVDFPSRAVLVGYLTDWGVPIAPDE